MRGAGLISALRPKHWTKNSLLFVPLVLSHRFSDWPLVISSAMAALSMCACSSGLYLANDVFDKESDCRHPVKRLRPVASGRLKMTYALLASVTLVAIGMALAAMVNAGVLTLIAGYVIAGLLYSLWIKRILVVDVIVLAGFYLLRVYLGGAATDIPISDWTALFCLMTFMSLATAKRYAEIRNSILDCGDVNRRRAYRQGDEVVLLGMGVSASIGAVIAMGLYTGGTDVVKLYRRPDLLRLECGVLLAWFGRFWFEVHRGAMVDEDPISLVLKARWSLALGLLTIALFLISI
ncbi:MAG: UbiA family prenyltransferase [Bryobacteraceae bacterium]|nr:UbiA family prenyltransferase [Bryobacteraceae bacterium]